VTYEKEPGRTHASRLGCALGCAFVFDRENFAFSEKPSSPCGGIRSLPNCCDAAISGKLRFFSVPLNARVCC
jgi:hypothetical protein